MLQGPLCSLLAAVCRCTVHKVTNGVESWLTPGRLDTLRARVGCPDRRLDGAGLIQWRFPQATLGPARGDPAELGRTLSAARPMGRWSPGPGSAPDQARSLGGSRRSPEMALCQMPKARNPRSTSGMRVCHLVHAPGPLGNRRHLRRLAYPGAQTWRESLSSGAMDTSRPRQEPYGLPDQEAFRTVQTFPDSARLWLAPSDATPRRWRRDRSAQTPSRDPIRKVCRPVDRSSNTVGKGRPGPSLPSSPHPLALCLIHVTFPGTLLPGPVCFCCSSDLVEFSQQQTNRLMAYLSG
ncbi:hypothetical protein VTN00DRAFT_1516 [Thermoascus crustaceus]|uniref:uncharacterized protein n=1 Tax=Thermoascus crustaceus TaxID=5088 RepID=UPI003743B216